MSRTRKILVWAALFVVVVIPLALAANSPLLAWREPVYIAAGFAGIIAMTVMLLQPLLVAGYLPGIPANRGRRIHRVTGSVLVLAILLHVAGLWITSPPDVVDALLFASPTPFSAWGVITMWAVFAAALLATLRRRLRLRWRTWRFGHMSLAAITVIGTVIHAVQIEGTMETISKFLLCAALIAVTAKTLSDLSGWTLFRPRR
ncbi:ferric reductase-like transmembrane domain-containing protein [Roseovarius sp. 2305UL8-3]|uniref:ferric reductase-like transmembrane domain-containing protein n=1 Tax=Roseovarius conchicola TaxID=3121636 RepID=UPI003526FD77